MSVDEMLRVDLISTAELPSDFPAGKLRTRRGPEGKTVILLQQFNHCGNCPWYWGQRGFLVPKELDGFLVYFAPIIVTNPISEEVDPSVYPSVCFQRGEGGVRLRQFSEKKGAVPRVANEPYQTLWNVWVTHQGFKAVPWIPVQWPHNQDWDHERFALCEWGIENHRLHPQTGELIKGHEVNKATIYSESELDETTAWMRPLIAEGRARIAAKA